MKQRITIDRYILLIAFGIYGVNRFFLKGVVDVPFLSYILKCHFNDFLGGICFPAYANLILAYSKFSHICIKNYWTSALIMFLCGICWEYIIPRIYPRGTCDPLDILSYVLGGLAYIFILKMTHRFFRSSDNDCVE